MICPNCWKHMEWVQGKSTGPASARKRTDAYKCRSCNYGQIISTSQDGETRLLAEIKINFEPVTWMSVAKEMDE